MEIETTEIIDGSDLRKLFVRGASIVRKVVAPTMGPKGRNIGIDRTGATPEITNDGKKSIHGVKKLKNKIEQMVVNQAQDITDRVAKIAGDNTSAAGLLYASLISEGSKKIDMGASPLFLRQGMEQAIEDITQALSEISVPYKNKNDIRNVATTSSESADIGMIMMEIFDVIGKDGQIRFEESKVPGISYDVYTGLKLASGYFSDYMITNESTGICEVDKPYVLVTDKVLSDFNEILPLLQTINGSENGLVIVASDFQGDALENILLNRLRRIMNILCIKVPGYGDTKRDILSDIAMFTGTSVVTSDSDLQLVDMTTKHLGRARSATAGKEDTDIIGGYGKKPDIKKYVDILREQKANPEITDFVREVLESRIANLSGGVGIIKIGANNGGDLIYLKDKIEDTIANTKGALEEGLVIGGGLALIRAGMMVKVPTEGNSDFIEGYKSVIERIKDPFCCIVENTGRKDALLLLSEITSGEGNRGYDARKGVLVPDMFKAGIVDSLKSIRTAFSLAVQGAAAILTIELTIVEDTKSNLI